MKKIITLLSFVAMALSPSVVEAADTGIDPSYLKIKVYKFAVSASELCTNPITIIDNSANPEYVNVFESPEFGAAILAQGTYPCVMIEMSDLIKVTSTEDSDSGNCVAGEELEMYVCQASNAYQLIDGSTGTCTSGEDRVGLFLSTTSTDTGSSANSFVPPTTTNDSTKGFNLAAALVVSGGVTGTFVVDGTGKIQDTNGACDMQPPIFGFR